MKFDIDSKLHESYIKMVQKGISNDEWNTFCRAETCSRQRNSNLWRGWGNLSKDEEGCMRNGLEKARSAAPSPETIPEPSQMLRTVIAHDNHDYFTLFFSFIFHSFPY